MDGADHAAAKAEIDRLLAPFQRRGRIHRFGAYALICGCFVACSFGAHYASSVQGNVVLALNLMLAGITGPAVMLVAVFVLTPRRHRRAALRSLLQIEDDVLVLDALVLIRRDVQWLPLAAEIDRSLAKRLLRLTQADAARLDRTWHRAIRRVIAGAADTLGLGLRGTPAKHLCGCLHVAGLIGDASHVQPLKRLAEMGPRDADRRAIRLEAEKALSALLARLDAGGDRLLRPAGGGAETLLRPSGEAGPGDEALLLRPAGSTQAAEGTEDAQR